MSKKLDRYIGPFGIQWLELDQLTRKVPLNGFFGTRRENVRTLYIFGTGDEANVPAERVGCYEAEAGAWVLLAGVSDDQVQRCLDHCGAGLRKLWIQNTDAEQVDLSAFAALEDLVLHFNPSLAAVKVPKAFRRLRRLQLGQTPWGNRLDLNSMEALESLALSHTNISQIYLDHPLPKLQLFGNDNSLEDWRFLTMLPGLQSLALYGDGAEGLPDLRGLQGLRELCFWNVSELQPEWLLLPDSLETLEIMKTELHHLPESIRGLPKLRSLNLSYSHLEELPLWLPDLGLEMSRMPGTPICLYHTQIDGVDMSVFDNSQEYIRQWFRDRQRGLEWPLNEAKVIFLGDGDVGKTYTIARLMNDGGQPEGYQNDSTPGVLIRHKNYDLGDRQVKVHFWDFGGQDEMQPMHRVFLSQDTLYMVLVDARSKRQNSQVRDWLRTVQSFADGSPVLVVVNKTDLNPNVDLDATTLKKEFANLRGIVYLSALNASREEFNTALTEAMKGVLAGMDILQKPLLHSSLELKAHLETMTENYIYETRFRQLCREKDVDSSEQFHRDILETFHKIGTCIRYNQRDNLQEYIVLKPEWIFNAVYAILFNRHPKLNNGILAHQDIHEMLQPNSGFKTTGKYTYSVMERNYVLGVIREFGLSVELPDSREFIPMLCAASALPIADAYESAPDSLEFHMKFSYLPDNVVHRLMAELHMELDLTQVWRYGARFVQRSSGLSAVVMKVEDELRIFVRGGNSLHRANTYLCSLKDAVEYILDKMELPRPLCYVVYKEDGRQDKFDYDLLLEAKADGDTDTRSRVFRRRIPIDNILNQTANLVERERMELVDWVVRECTDLQSGNQYWAMVEDLRTHEIAQMLRAREYLVTEQEETGVSPAGKGKGKVDLDIRREQLKPWTRLEALRVRRDGENDQTNWENHLLKLLKNYNVHNLEFLLLVSYLDTGDAKFFEISHAIQKCDDKFHKEDYKFINRQQIDIHRQFGQYARAIQVFKSRYQGPDAPITVYHIFVRMGE